MHDPDAIGHERADQSPDTLTLMSAMHQFIVMWGRMGRFDFVSEVVDAWDPDDAMVIAADLHPELPRPRVAILASQAGPLYADLIPQDRPAQP